MIKLSKIILVLLLTPFIAVSQTVIKGVVYEKMDKTPVAGAVISLIDENQELIAYDISSANGGYTLSINKTDKKIMLVGRMLGYKEEQRELENKSQEQNIYLEQTGIELKEVTIKSKPISVSEDTLKYSVNTFKSAGDRVIGDILKKLPGIEVEKNGGIKYNGEPINKFYIEGLDLLESKYGLATNNVPVDAVQNVEVIENHQPIKSIKGMISSAQAAINLKLKDDKMARPIGGIRAGGGYSDKLNWLFEIFALQASKKRQTLVMYKTNNTGNNINNEFSDQAIYLRELQNETSGFEKNVLTAPSISIPSIEEERYLFNQSHAGSVNNLWKTGEDSQIKINLNYLNDLQTQNQQSESNYFLQDSTLRILEANSLFNRNILIDGELSFTDNSKEHYIDNALKWKVKSENSVLGTNSNGKIVNQQFNLPYTVIQDKLDYLKRLDNDIINIGSLFAYTYQPEKLIVSKNGRIEEQHIGISNFYAKTGSYYSWFWGLSSIRIDGLIEASINSVSSDLSGTVFTDSLCSRFQSKQLKIELTPAYYYKTQKAEIKIGLATSDQVLFKDDKTKNTGTNTYNYIFVNPNANISYKFNVFLSSNISYRYSQKIGDYIDFMDAFMMKNYRNYYKSSGNISLSKSHSVSLSLNYRNPLSSFFCNTYISYFPRERNKMIAQRFVGIQSISSDVMMINKSNMLMGEFYVGKYFSKIKTNFSLTTNYKYYDASRLQQGVLYPYSSNTLGLTFKSNTKVSDILTFVYKANYLTNQTAIKTSAQVNKSTLGQFGQQFITYFSPGRKMEFNFQLEQSYNELGANNSVNMLFANLGATYKLKRVDLDLNWNNIFNKKEYSYSVFNGLDNYSYKYGIRPMSILLTVSFKY